MGQDYAQVKFIPHCFTLRVATRGTEADKKLNTHIPSPCQKKKEKLFFVKNIFTDGAESPHSREVLLNSIFSKEAA